MRLKRLTLIGFKSFADKTEIDFQPGITAIVGPNGSGKSNIADAILWVLGEQSAKALRGDSMADVIFNGTDTRKPLSMAEVSLTICDIQPGELYTAGIKLDQSEITITRRVYRDGHGEYFINRIPCRLRDIQLLFAGTGMGRLAYSILSQGNITQIISAKPDQRRIVFEEAAGITRSKTQKKEAIKKLEQTEQNILRLQDVLQEVQRRHAALQRQAAKARRYQRYSARLKLLDTIIANRNFHRLMEEKIEAQKVLEELEQRILNTQSELSIQQSAYRDSYKELEELKVNLEGQRENKIQLQAQIKNLIQRIEFIHERCGDISKQQQVIKSELDQLNCQLSRIEQETNRAEDELRSLEQRHQQTNQDLQTIEKRLSVLLQLIDEEKTQRKLLHEQLFAVARELANYKNQLVSIDLKRSSIKAAKDRVKNEIQLLSRQLEHYQKHLTIVQSELAEKERELPSIKERINQLEEQINAVSSQETKLQADIQSIKRLLEQHYQHKQQIEAKLANRDGVPQHVKRLIESVDKELPLLSEKFQVNKGASEIITTLLGQILDALIVPDPQVAEKLISKNKELGNHPIVFIIAQRLSLPLDKIVTEAHAAAALKEIPCEPILLQVSFDPSLQTIFSRLLGKTYLVPDFLTAWKAWCLSRGWFSFITVSGELVTKEGICFAGKGAIKEYGLILQYKEQLQFLQKETKALEEELFQKEQVLRQLQLELSVLKEEFGNRTSKLKELETSVITNRNQLENIKATILTIEQQIQDLSQEERLLEEEQATLETQAQLIVEQVRGVETKEQELKSYVEQMEHKLIGLEKEKDQLNAQKVQVYGTVTAVKENIENWRRRINGLQRRKEEIILAIQTRQSLFEENERQLQILINERQMIQHQVETLEEQLNNCNSSLNALENKVAVLTERVQALELSISELRKALEDLNKDKAATELKLSKLTMSAENIISVFKERHGINLASIEQGKEIEMLFPNADPILLSEVNEWYIQFLQISPEQQEEQVHELHERIRQMGEINLLAIQEYEEVEQRRKFLEDQLLDLRNAQKQLIDLITRINTQTQQMFLETFSQIRRNFNSIFTEIFGGGRADLVLIDENNILESGIDIIARPPGKQIQSIELLSGGEQAMTAVAILFAIYMVKPSPFCVLDELDAPLDDLNIERFIRIVRRFVSSTQFIIITHNKNTISMADAVYGVTMPERGVSQVLSLKLSDFKKQSSSFSPQIAEFPPR